MNALAATAAAWAAGLNPAMIVRALTTFKTDTITVPGRFNLFELNGIEVIVDYGHNVAAMRAMGEAIEALEPRRTVMAFTLPGDRRDEDLIATTEATIPFVDAYVLYDSENLRGRRCNEVPELIQRQLPSDIPCEVADSERSGILQAWRYVQPGDRLIVICDEVDETLKILHGVAEAVAEHTACINPLTQEFDPASFHRETVGFPALTGVSGHKQQ